MQCFQFIEPFIETEHDQFTLKQMAGTELTANLFFGTKAFIHVYFEICLSVYEVNDTF